MSPSSSPEGPGSVPGAPHHYCLEEAPERILEALEPARLRRLPLAVKGPVLPQAAQDSRP